MKSRFGSAVSGLARVCGLVLLPAAAAAQAPTAPALLSAAAQADLAARVEKSDAGWAALASLYVTPADIATCRAGVVTEAAKREMLTGVNAVRAIHALPPVTYAADADPETAAAALMMVANNQLSHAPPADWKCYSAAGSRGAGSSNLAGGVTSPYLLWNTPTDHLADWLRDANSTSIGHRRWLLSPFLRQISYGRADQVLADGGRTDAAALKVFNFAPGAAPAAAAALPDFVAYPFGTYPAHLFAVGDLLSFTVVADKTSLFGNGAVDLGKAVITVSVGAASLPVKDVAATGGFFGNGNSLQWRVVGLRRGVPYHVTITNVANAPRTTYSYEFRLEPGPEPGI